jgi:hypothetical protein
MGSLYSTLRWRAARAAALRRDGNHCAVGRWFGGACDPILHVHHLCPVSDGGDPYALDNLLTVCAAHHPMLEAFRARVTRHAAPAVPRCPHRHRTEDARRQCEARLRRERVAA